MMWSVAAFCAPRRFKGFHGPALETFVLGFAKGGDNEFFFVHGRFSQEGLGSTQNKLVAKVSAQLGLTMSHFAHGGIDKVFTFLQSDCPA